MRFPLQTVLCPTDLSDIGDAAIPLAYRIVGSGGTVHLMHVCEPPHLGNPLYGQYVQGYVPTPEELAAGQERVKRRLHQLAPDGATADNIRTQFHLVEGVNPADVIIEQARRLEVEAVIMGTHGRTGLGRLLMGSVAAEVVKRDGVPVILMHADHEGQG